MYIIILERKICVCFPNIANMQMYSIWAVFALRIWHVLYLLPLPMFEGTYYVQAVLCLYCNTEVDYNGVPHSG